MPRYHALVSILFICSLLPGCKKKTPDDMNCDEISKIKIVAPQTSFSTGDAIHLTTNAVPVALYFWTLGDNPNSLSTTETLDIPYATKNNEGWYRLALGYPECASGFDSIYITVTNKAVTTPCNPADNTISFTSIPNISVATTYGLNSDWNCKDLYGYQGSGYPDFHVYFDFFWNDKEPEDGAYSISPTITFEDGNPYSVYISSLYSDIFFQANPGTVYVSHVNGKLAVTICGVSLIGDDGGPTFTTNATGKLVAP